MGITRPRPDGGVKTGITRPRPDGGVIKKTGITRPRPDGGVKNPRGALTPPLFSLPLGSKICYGQVKVGDLSYLLRV